MRRFNILHVLMLATIGVDIYKLATGGEFGAMELVLLVSAPIGAVLTFIVGTHEGKPRECFVAAFDGMLLAAALGVLCITLLPTLHAGSFGALIAAAIGAGVVSGFLCPKRYRAGLRI